MTELVATHSTDTYTPEQTYYFLETTSPVLLLWNLHSNLCVKYNFQIIYEHHKHIQMQFTFEKQNHEHRFDGISLTTYLYLFYNDLTLAE